MSDKPELRLPGASVSSPTCGACFEETVHEDGYFHCEGCRIMYDANDPESPGEYIDDEDEPCGHQPAEKPYVKEHPEGSGRHYLFSKYPCPLPKGHKHTGPFDDGHHYPSDAKLQETTP